MAIIMNFIRFMLVIIFKYYPLNTLSIGWNDIEKVKWYKCNLIILFLGYKYYKISVKDCQHNHDMFVVTKKKLQSSGNIRKVYIINNFLYFDK